MKHRSGLHCCVLLSGAAIAACAAVPPAPAPVRVPATQSLIKQLHGTGVQIYECRPGKQDAALFEWIFVGPEARLTTGGGRAVATHYAGPTWEAKDGSRVVAQAVASSRSPNPNSIPLLLLRARGTSGKGLFSHVQFIQRLNTKGGSLLATGCRKDQAGQQLRAAYTADYLFYGQKH